MNLKFLKGMKDEDVLVNVDNITCVVTSPESKEQCLIYFNGESDNCIRVKHDIITVKNRLL